MQRSCSGHMLVIFRKLQGDCCGLLCPSGLGWVVKREVGDGVRELGDQGEDLAYTLNEMGSHRRGIMGFKGVTLYLCTGVKSRAAEKSSKQRIENWLLR